VISQGKTLSILLKTRLLEDSYKFHPAIQLGKIVFQKPQILHNYFKPMEIFVTVVTIFVLAIFVGFEIITKIPPILHTPLMSGSNAISGITLIGALYAAGIENNNITKILGLLSVIFATINVVGGFLVTHRMLGMFKKKD